MRKPREMSPMKAMMGIKKSSTPSARTLKRASGQVLKAGSGKLSMPQVAKTMTPMAPLMRKTLRPFGEKASGPKLRLDVGKTVMPNMETAQSTPAIAGGVKAAATPIAPAVAKASAKVLKKAAKISKSAAKAK